MQPDATDTDLRSHRRRADDDVHTRLARLAVHLLHADAAWVIACHGGAVTLRASAGLLKPLGSPGVLPVDAGALLRCVPDGDGVLAVDDLQSHPQLNRTAFNEIGVRSVLAIRLALPSGVGSAALWVLGCQPRQWSKEDVSLLTDLAGVASLAPPPPADTEAVSPRRKEEALLLLAESAPCLLWCAEVEDHGSGTLGWVHSLNEAEAQRFFPVQQAAGQSYANAWYESRVEPDRTRSDEIGDAEVRAGRSFTQEYRCRRLDGEIRWLAEHVRVETVAPGRWSTVGICIDVTEQKRAEAALREREEQLRLAMEAANLVAWGWDLHEGAHRSAEAMERVFGHSAETCRPDFEWWTSRIHPEDRPAVLETLEALPAGPDRHWSHEYRFQRGDGSFAHVVDYARVVRDAAGRPERMVGAMHDVSQTRLLQEQLLHAQKMEAVGRLAGGVAHDFNNLLSVINGYGELLAKDNAMGSLQRRSLQHIQDAGARAADLTRQLLAFGRKQIVAPRLLDLGAVLLGTSGMLERIIGEDIEVVISIEPGLPRVSADPGQLEQVVLNLAVNARDAMPDGGTLTLELQRVEVLDGPPEAPDALSPGAYALLKVSDTGIGIEASVLPRIFEPFFTTKEMGRGTGLGLATIYGILKQHGGHATVESQLGRGTTFSVYLPLHPEAPRDAPDADGPVELICGTERVLVVEDEAMVRNLVVSVLEECGYEVLAAAGLEAALALCAEYEGQIDLLLTDVVMPGGSGRALVDTATRRYPGIAALYMSGYTDDAVIRNGVSSAETHFLQKPFSPLELTQKVRDVLNRRMPADAS